MRQCFAGCSGPELRADSNRERELSRANMNEEEIRNQQQLQQQRFRRAAAPSSCELKVAILMFRALIHACRQNEKAASAVC
jgi:hypothetical protein